MAFRNSKSIETIVQLIDCHRLTLGNTISNSFSYSLFTCLFYSYATFHNRSFNQLDLPAYETYDKLRTYLLKAIHECSEGFGFA